MSDLDSIRRPISALPLRAKIDVPGFPDWVAIDEVRESVWISNRDFGEVDLVRPTSNRFETRVAVDTAPCCGLAIGDGSLWVPCCGSRSVVRVDLASNRIVGRVAISIASSEGAIAADGSGVWVPTDGGQSIARIDPRSNTVSTKVSTPGRTLAVALDRDALWASCTDLGRVIRVDVAGNRIVDQVDVGGRPRYLSVGFGSVWVLNQQDGTVSRIDSHSNRVSATISLEIPGEGGDIAIGAGSVWVTSFGKPLSRIDPSTNTVARQFVAETAAEMQIGDALRVGLGSVWLCSFGLQQLWRIDPSV